MNNITFAIGLAFLMTFITASSNIILKKSFTTIPTFLAVYFSVLVSTILLWIATYLFVPRNVFLNYKGIMIFVLIGSFAPTLVRTLTYCGIDKLGAGRSAPLRAMTPFFATIFAIIFLKEKYNIGIFVGIIFIILGVIFLAKKEKSEPGAWKHIHFFYPLCAAVLAGVAANLRKYGMGLMPQAIFASTVAATTSLVILTVYVLLKFRKEASGGLRSIRGFKLIIVAAFLTSVGEIVDLSALLYGKVSLVVPIFAATPLIIVFFTWIFLKKEEVVTRKLVFSTILIVTGIFFIIKNAS